MGICLSVGDNPGKLGLIPHVALGFMDLSAKAVMRFRIGPPPIS